MHHYASKEMLVDAFLAKSSEQCLSATRQHLDGVPRGGGRRTTAFVDQVLREPAMGDQQGAREMAAVMIALMQGGLTERRNVPLGR